MVSLFYRFWLGTYNGFVHRQPIAIAPPIEIVIQLPHGEGFFPSHPTRNATKNTINTHHFMTMT
jgi:hypothetical protein